MIMQTRRTVASYPLIFRQIQRIFNSLGLAIVKIDSANLTANEINLNIGSADSKLPGFINLDMPSNWYSKVQARNSFIPFNAFLDELPFEEQTVSNIYISHVIEHLPESVVERLITNSLRCLKPNGVLRLCFPDAEFLYSVTKKGPQFWNRKETNFFSNNKSKRFDPNEYDYLTQELASWSRLEFDPLLRDAFEDQQQLKLSEFEDAMNIAHSHSKYSAEFPGRHISWWTYSKLENLFHSNLEYLFPRTQIILSKYQGSVSSRMTGFHFDKSVPFLSAYVEFVKA
jgi:SAM-dependent methyltransferase